MEFDKLVSEHRRKLVELETALADPSVFGNQKKLREVNMAFLATKRTVDLANVMEQLTRDLAGARVALNDDDADVRTMAAAEVADIGGEVARCRTSTGAWDSFRAIHATTMTALSKSARAQVATKPRCLLRTFFKMYTHFAESHDWRIDIMSQSQNDLGGFKEIIFEVQGAGAYGTMKYESGVHRVQRVPSTEKAGRIHTSTVTVAVLPKIEERLYAQPARPHHRGNDVDRRRRTVGEHDV